MTDPYSISKDVYKVVEKLKSTVEQLHENQEDIYALARDLINNTEDLMDLRNKNTGTTANISDSLLGAFIQELVSIRIALELLLPKHGNKPLERAIHWGKNLYKADSVKKKISKLHDRVREAKLGFVAKLSVCTTQSLDIVQHQVSQLKQEVDIIVRLVDSDSSVASTCFGVDRMTSEQRKKAFHKTQLDISVATKEDNIAILRVKIRTLKKALDENAPTLYDESDWVLKQGFKIEQDDPFYDIHKTAWRRQDALLETLKLMDVLSDSASSKTMPAIVCFVKADRLSKALHSLGLFKEALQLCSIAHEIISNLEKDNQVSCQDYLCECLLTLSLCRSGMGDFEGAFAASKEAVKTSRALVATDPDASKLILARSLNSLSVDLAYSGEGMEALTASQEAVQILQELHAQFKTNSDDIGHLALFMGNLSLRLCAVGQKEKAFVTAKETVEICRTIAKMKSDAPSPQLAMLLGPLSICLVETQKVEEALDALEEVTEIYRTLVEHNLDVFICYLGGALLGLATLLSRLERKDKALVLMREAVEISRTLVKTDPAFNSNLVDSLNTLARCLYNTGQRIEALDVIKEAAEISRTLVRMHGVVYHPSHANTLNTLSYCFSGAGKREDALVVSREVVEIFRALVKEYPVELHCTRDMLNTGLAKYLDSLSYFLTGLGRREEAFTASQEAVEIQRAVLKSNPDLQISADLALLLMTLCISLRGMGENENALVAMRESANLCRTVSESREGFPEFKQEFLAQSQMELANQLARTAGEAAGALAAAEESIEIYRRLAEDLPMVHKPNLVLALNTLSVCQNNMDRKVEALATANEAVEISREIVNWLPDAFNPSLAESLRTLSICMKDSGDAQNALIAIEESTDMYRRLFKHYKDYFGPLLADTLDNLTLCLQLVGRTEDAHSAEEEVRRIRKYYN